MADVSTIIHWVVELLTLAAAVTLTIVAKNYVPSYLKEKGKNLATREDIANITNEIESVKRIYAQHLELVRASLGSRAHIHQVRYEREFNILLQISGKVVELRDSIVALHPDHPKGAVQILGSSLAPIPELDRIFDNPEQEQKHLLKRAHDAAHDFYNFTESHGPFFPADIYDAMTKLNDDVGLLYFVGYSFPPSSEGESSCDAVLDNVKRIQSQAHLVLSKIRNRVRDWERFDPGPDSDSSLPDKR